MNGDSPIVTVSKVYADIFINKPSSLYTYENYTPITDNIDNYSLIRKIGQGKYSLVFEGVNNIKNEKIIVKVLKAIRKSKMRREIKILEYLKNGINIINLLNIVTLPTNQYALIFKLIPNYQDFKDIYLDFNEMDTRYYIYEILKALDFCHSHGIMHRDIKPHNIIVDRNNRRLYIIDFGLAEYYHPGERYNVRVASRHFKSPELLVDYCYYDYSLDLWSLGCILATMLFRKEPFFCGNDNRNQLYCIVEVLGTAGLEKYLEKYRIQIDPILNDCLKDHRKRTWQSFVHTENEHLIVNGTVFDLLERLLCYDHLERINAKEAMEHKYFLPLKY